MKKPKATQNIKRWGKKTLALGLVMIMVMAMIPMMASAAPSAPFTVDFSITGKVLGEDGLPISAFVSTAADTGAVIALYKDDGGKPGAKIELDGGEAELNADGEFSLVYDASDDAALDLQPGTYWLVLENNGDSIVLNTTWQIGKELVDGGFKKITLNDKTVVDVSDSGSPAEYEFKAGTVTVKQLRTLTILVLNENGTGPVTDLNPTTISLHTNAKDYTGANLMSAAKTDATHLGDGKYQFTGLYDAGGYELIIGKVAAGGFDAPGTQRYQSPARFNIGLDTPTANAMTVRLLSTRNATITIQGSQGGGLNGYNVAVYPITLAAYNTTALMSDTTDTVNGKEGVARLYNLDDTTYLVKASRDQEYAVIFGEIEVSGSNVTRTYTAARTNEIVLTIVDENGLLVDLRDDFPGLLPTFTDAVADDSRLDCKSTTVEARYGTLKYDVSNVMALSSNAKYIFTYPQDDSFQYASYKVDRSTELVLYAIRSIEITVTDESTGNEVEDAELTLYIWNWVTNDWDARSDAPTEEDGKYLFDGLSFGRYKVTAEYGNGFQPDEYIFDYDADTPVNAYFVHQQDFVKKAFRTVSITVYLEETEDAEDLEPVSGASVAFGGNAVKTTNAEGKTSDYVDVFDGKYSIGAWKVIDGVEYLYAGFEDIGKDNVNLVVYLIPADTINVTTVTVSGTVTDIATGLPIAGATVYFGSETAGGGWTNYWTETDADGEFSRELPVGTYDINVWADDYYGSGYWEFDLNEDVELNFALVKIPSGGSGGGSGSGGKGTTAAPAEVKNPTTFVEGLYKSILGRDALPGEVDMHMPGLEALGAAAVIRAFIFSIEAEKYTNMSTEAFVIAMYEIMLGRTPAAEEIGPWVLNVDVFGKEVIFDEFVKAAEFLGVCAAYGVNP